jgi:hypothetical protein
LALRFFGLTLESVSAFEIARIMEPAFSLVYYGGFTNTDIDQMQVQRKIWYMERLSKEITKGADDGSGTRATHQNTPEIRELQGRQRTTGPARTRRFT